MPPRPASRPAARRAEKTVTRAFLFSDLRGYTDFVESRGDATAASLLREYRGLVRAAIGEQGGVEVKTEGDSFYVVFESALAALECAVAIHRAAQAHNQAKPESPIRIGMGLHVGETVPYDDQFVGGAVNVAARLAAKAKAGELVVSDTFRGLVRTGQRYAMEDLGPQRLKGVTERLRAWMVEWRDPAAREVADPAAVMVEPSTGTGVASSLLGRSEAFAPRPVPGQLVCPVVVGRTAERARFAEHLAHARDGRGQAVLLSGEAGVGKSAFTRQAIDAATAQGFRVLYGVTVESDGGLPYAPFVAAVRSGFRGIDRDRLGRVLSQTAPDLAQLFPELSKTTRSEPGSTIEQQRLSVAFQGLFSAFAREAPVLLVVEDLHWCDEASLALLHYLARELRDTRVLLLGTYRSDEMHRRHPLLRVLASMQRERVVGEIALGRLTRDEVRELIHATLLPTDPTVQVGDEFRDALYDRAEGNPFFTEELIKSLVDSGDVFHSAETGWSRKPIEQMKIPGSVREAVRTRIEKLSPEAQATLSAAAAIGLRSSFDLLRTVRALSEGDLEGHLREAIDQQLVIELGGRTDEYGFRHALTKEVVYDDLMVRERKRLHRAVADALIADPQAEPALVAHHLIAAADQEAAVPYLLEAAQRAYRAFAPRDAAAHFEKAIEIGLPADQLGPTLEALAETYYLFDFARSRKAAEEATALYRERRDPRGASRMLRLASRNVWQQGEATRPAELAQEAIDILDGLGETVELGRAIANLAGLRMVARADEEAVALSDRALEIGERTSDTWTIANAQITKGTALRNLGQRGEGSALLQQGLALAKDAGLADVALRAYNNLVIGPVLEPVARERLLEEGIAYAERHGLEQPMLTAGRAWGAFLRGDWDVALAVADRVPEGSFWHEAADAIRVFVGLGRQGPGSTIGLARRRAEEALGHPEAQRAAAPLVQMTFVAALADDRAECERWSRELQARVRAEPGWPRHIAVGPINLLMPAAAYLGEPAWVDLLAEAVSADVAGDLPRALLQATRSFFTGDAAACGRDTTAYYELSSQRWGVPPAGLLFARELRRSGATLGPEWERSFAMLREHLERARADWYLAELAKLEA